MELQPVSQSNNLLLGKNDNTIKKINTFFKPNLIPEIIIAAIPNVAYYTLINLSLTLNLYFISKSENANLVDAVGLGNACIETACYKIISSLNAGLNTLISQAFGAKEYKLIGQYFHRAMLINAVVFFFLYLINFFSGSILMVLGYDSTISYLVQDYIRSMLFAMVGNAVFDTLRVFAQGHLVFDYPVYIQVACGIFEIFTSYYFISVKNMGLTGLGISRGICEFAKCTALAIFLSKSLIFKQSLFMSSKGFHKGTLKQLSFQIFCGATVYLELFAYHVEVFIAASLGRQFTSFIITIQIMMFIWAASAGFNQVLSTFAAKSMGERNPIRAKEYTTTGIIFFCSISIVESLILIFAGNYLGSIFTNDPDISSHVVNVLLIYAWTNFFDVIQFCMSGVVRSIGKEKLNTCVFLISFYVVGVPLCYIFGIPMGWGIVGIAWGNRMAQFINLFAFSYIVYSLDWDGQCLIISERMKSDHHIPVEMEVIYSEEYTVTKNEEDIYQARCA